MLTENGLQVDLDAVADVLRRADVQTIGFATFPQRLLVDTRWNEQAPPLVAIVNPVASVQERYQWLGEVRGFFGAPQAFSFFVWPQTVRSMVEMDALGPLRARLAETHPEAAARLDEALAALLAAEAAAMRDAVRGGPAWQTMWERRPAA